MAGTDGKIDVVFDMDGVIIANDSQYAPDAFYGSFNDQYLPQAWRDYKKHNIRPIRYKGSYVLFTPYILEALQYCFINLRAYIRIIYFSAGPEERNNELAAIITDTIALNVGIDPTELEYKVLSFTDCVIVPRDSPAQPCSANNPHIPKIYEKAWYRNEDTVKKCLSERFGDLSKVILIDNSHAVVMHGEESNHLKVMTYRNFSGADLLPYVAGNNTDSQKRLHNCDFFRTNRLFYSGNIAFFIIGAIEEILRISYKLNIPPSEALELTQICPKSNFYKSVLEENPLYERYNLDWYYEGFLKLSNVFPYIKLFAPYPEFALEDLTLFCDQHYGSFLKRNLWRATKKYWDPLVIQCINEYYGDIQSNMEESLGQTAVKSDISISSTNEVANTSTQIIDDQVKIKVITERRHSTINMDETFKALILQGVFSQQAKGIVEKKIVQDVQKNNDTPSNNTNNNHAVEVSRCCAIL